MTKGKGKRNCLPLAHGYALRDLFEETVPASMTEWLHVREVPEFVNTPVVSAFLKPHIDAGHLWNYEMFARFATLALGFPVKASNVKGMAEACGYDLSRKSPTRVPLETLIAQRDQRDHALLKDVIAVVKLMATSMAHVGSGPAPWKDLIEKL